MNKMKINREMRLWLLGPVLLLWSGIFLSGFENVHWLIYIPAILALFASVTGICIGMYLIRGILLPFIDKQHK